jgi:hypothetical protein
MSNRVSESFESLMSQMQEPPTWNEVSAQQLTATRPVSLNGPWIALVAGLATVLVIGAVVFLFPGADPIGGGSIPYVRLAWSQEVDMRCIGMETIDDGGFDSAVIEIWGPNRQEFYRIDVTAPDGTVERLLVDATDFPEDSRWWSTPDHGAFGRSFRSSECSTSVGNQSSSYSVSQPPVIHGLFPVEFTGLFAEWYDAEQGEIEARLNDRFVRVRDDTWRGSPVVVYAESHTFTDEFGLTRSIEERWVDLAAERVERLVTEFDTELIARSAVNIEVVERAEVAADTVSFSTEGMFPGPGNDIPPPDGESNEATTTSITPTAHPIMANAVQIDAEDIFTEALVEVVEPGPADSFFAVPVSEFQLLVRLRPGVPAHLYATSCDVLIQVELPHGWEGTCLERTVNGERELGVFPYDTVSD